MWYWGKPASHGLRLHGNDNHFSIGFFCYKKEKYWTKLFSNVQQRLSYSSSNSWLLQMSCTTILSVTMEPKPLWIVIRILNTIISRENFKNVMFRLLGIWNNSDISGGTRVRSLTTLTKCCPLLTTYQPLGGHFHPKTGQKGPFWTTYPPHLVNVVFERPPKCDLIITLIPSNGKSGVGAASESVRGS